MAGGNGGAEGAAGPAGVRRGRAGRGASGPPRSREVCGAGRARSAPVRPFLGSGLGCEQRPVCGASGLGAAGGVSG